MTNDTLAAIQDRHAKMFTGECACGQSPCQVRTLLDIMDARIAARGAIIDNEIDKKNEARAELTRIVSEFGDYDMLVQSRQICDRRGAQVRAAAALANQWYVEDESVSFALALREALLHAT